jgi:hypothetical protein
MKRYLGIAAALGLLTAGSAFIREGKSLDETKQLVKLTKYEKWGNYQQWLPLNVEGMYRYMSIYRRPN